MYHIYIYIYIYMSYLMFPDLEHHEQPLNNNATGFSKAFWIISFSGKPFV